MTIKGGADVKDETIVALSAIGGLVLLECVALYMRLDGQIFSIVIAAIAGIAGYEIKARREVVKP